MKVNCPHCDQKYNIDDSMLGQELDCQKCQKKMTFDKPKTSTSPASEGNNQVNCPKCDQKYVIRDDQFGSEIQCQSCEHVMLFPAPAKAPPKQTKLATTKPTLNTTSSSAPFTPARKQRKRGFNPAPLLTLLILGGAAYFGYKEYEKVKNKKAPEETVVTADTPVAPPKPKPIKEVVKKPKKKPKKTLNPNAVIATEVIPDVEAQRNEDGNLFISQYDEVVKPFAEKHCIQCHGPDKVRGKFRIDHLMNTGLVRSEADAEYWQEVLDLINIGDMPPEDEEQPGKEELTAMLDALYNTTANARDIVASKGNGVMRRLNSREYTNLIQDRLGLTVPEGVLPRDRGAFGFDTLGLDLTTTPAELQGYIDVGYSLMKKLTSDFAAGREIPEEALIVFGDMPPNATNKDALPLFKRFIVNMYNHQPVTGKMISDMMGIYNFNRRKGASFWESASLSMTCALASPNLIYIIEQEVALTQLDIANRLSILLWSSIPDETLIKLANEGKLTDPEVYAQQFDRMIQDPKASRFFETFTHQWLELGRLDIVNFDGKIYPKLKEQEESLKQSMDQETKSFIRHLILENKPARELAKTDFTMLNSQLAEHYGIQAKNLKEDKFSKVVLKGKDKVRGGLLGQGSVQMLTSNGARTSPVERGVYIMRKLLDSSPPPAPADVPEAEDVPGKNQTTRDLLKHHMTTAQCATCHAKIDPLGFGMESFGPLGRWRTHEGKIPIDASGQMTNGVKFDGYEGLLANLAVNDERIAKSFVKALMSYGIGRNVRYTDSGDIKNILDASKDNKFKLKDLILEVTKSDTFRTKS